MALDPADTLEILQLAARYNHAIDYGDPEAWAGTFTADGTFNTATGRPARPRGPGEVRGRLRRRDGRRPPLDQQPHR